MLEHISRNTIGVFTAASSSFGKQSSSSQASLSSEKNLVLEQSNGFTVYSCMYVCASSWLLWLNGKVLEFWNVRQSATLSIFIFFSWKGGQYSSQQIPNFNPLSANPTKWSNTLKQLVDNLQTNCLSVFDHFVWLELKGLNVKLRTVSETKTGVNLVNLQAIFWCCNW